jgi:flagellum-specific peptidoglycan hydrolase FlgJ
MSLTDISTDKLAFRQRAGLAMQHARKSVRGLILASLGTAQMIWESDWGKKSPGNNFLGIKAYGVNPKTVNFATHEAVNGNSEPTHANFMAYDSMEDCAMDYAQIISTHEPYAKAVALLNGHQNSSWDTMIADGSMSVAEAFIRKVCACYATDPQYANGILGTIRGYALDGFDCPVDLP